MVLDWLLKLGKSKAGAIARVTGKSPEEIRKAIDAGAKLLPEIARSKNGGIDILQKVGVTPDFIREMQSRYGGYIGRIPGLSQDQIEGVSSALGGNREQRRAAQPGKKYPKV